MGGLLSDYRKAMMPGVGELIDGIGCNCVCSTGSTRCVNVHILHTPALPTERMARPASRQSNTDRNAYPWVATIRAWGYKQFGDRAFHAFACACSSESSHSPCRFYASCTPLTLEHARSLATSSPPICRQHVATSRGYPVQRRDEEEEMKWNTELRIRHGSMPTSLLYLCLSDTRS